MDETVTLIIPSAPEYVGVARLTLLGVASRLGFSYDAVEDIRLAVAEACTSAIARSLTFPSDSPQITLRARGDAKQLTVEVEDNARKPGTTPTVDSAETASDNLENEPELGALLMELFMDEVEVRPSAQGTLVRLVKYNNDTRR